MLNTTKRGGEQAYTEGEEGSCGKTGTSSTRKLLAENAAEFEEKSPSNEDVDTVAHEHVESRHEPCNNEKKRTAYLHRDWNTNLMCLKI